MTPHSASRIDHLATELRSLNASLERFQKDAGRPPEWDALADPIRARIAALAREAIVLSAGSVRDLALKAGIVLDWLDPNGADIPILLSASLCRDIALLFPVADA